jgi:hypothetical protein
MRKSFKLDSGKSGTTKMDIDRLKNSLFRGKRKYLVVFLLLALFFFFIAVQRNKNESIQGKIMECLELGSDYRAKTCIKLLISQTQKKSVSQPDFPINSLVISEVSADEDKYCINVDGVVTNNSGTPANKIDLRIDFSETQDSRSFHYEIFPLFFSETDSLDAYSSKRFSRCLPSTAVKGYKTWYYSIRPQGARALVNDVAN